MMSFSLSNYAEAQLVPCTGMYPTNTAASFPVASVSEDVVVNTDMILHGNILDEIKAIAYSKRSSTPNWSGDESHVFIEDWAGNNLTINLAPGASRADVALADRYNATTPLQPGAPITYRLIVAYQIGMYAYYDVWQIDDCGTPSMNATQLSMIPLTTISGQFCDTLHNGPHIDTWTDDINRNADNNEPSVHKFAIVWTEGPSILISPMPIPTPGTTTLIAADRLYYLADDLDAPSGAAPIYLGSDASMPDVACITDLATRDEYLEIAYVTYPGAGALRHLEYPITFPPALPQNSTSSLATTVDMGPVMFRFPRIEALSNWWSWLTYTKWQIVVSKSGFATGLPAPAPTYTNQAVSYDNFGGPTWLSNGYLGEQIISPCVAAGSGIAPSGPGSWSNDYYSGFFPWTSDHVITRSNSFVTHVLDPQWWEVNTSSFSYPWDAARSFHISTSSNSLRDLLTAWYDGSDILYKVSPTNVPLAFRQPTNVSGTAQSGIQLSLFPNPVSSILHFEGAKLKSELIIHDLCGKRIANGHLLANNTLDVSSLAPAQYAITLVTQNGKLETLKFVKK